MPLLLLISFSPLHLSGTAHRQEYIHLDRRYLISAKACVIHLQLCPVRLLYRLLIEQPHILYLFKRCLREILSWSNRRSDGPIVSNVYPQDDVKPSSKGIIPQVLNTQKRKYILKWEDFGFDSLQAFTMAVCGKYSTRKPATS